MEGRGSAVAFLATAVPRKGGRLLVIGRGAYSFLLKCFVFQTIRPVVSRKNAVFPFYFCRTRVSPFSKAKRSGFRTHQGLLTLIFIFISNKYKVYYTLFLKISCRMACVPLEKSAFEEGWGRRNSPCAPAATEWRPQAVPVASKEATGIDSRDNGAFPFYLAYGSARVLGRMGEFEGEGTPFCRKQKGFLPPQDKLKIL